MQDLKKQTALRLAQEQGRLGDVPIVDATPQGTASHNTYSSRSRSKHNKTYHQETRGASNQSNKVPLNCSAPSQFRSHIPTDMRQQSSAHSVVTPMEQQSYIRPALTHHSLSTNRSVDSAADKGANSKLPHGLTVHELKEMTKARLAAERGVAIPSTVHISSPGPSVYTHDRGSIHHEYAVETWETASVSSVASDYPASLNGATSFAGDEPIPFAQSSSYLNTNRNNYTPENDWADQYNTPTNSSYAPNRRRAATLSPRPDLVHNLNELYTVVPPSISKESSTHPSSAGDISPIARFLEGNNRARTFSTVSLPILSHTEDEFAGPPQPIRFCSHFDSLREDVTVTGLTDVFRGPTDFDERAAVRAFPSTADSSLGVGSFVSGDVAMRMRAATTTGSTEFATTSSNLEDPRNRAATWSEPSLDIFFGGQYLSEDLASILKLSGAEQRDS